MRELKSKILALDPRFSLSDRCYLPKFGGPVELEKRERQPTDSARACEVALCGLISRHVYQVSFSLHNLLSRSPHLQLAPMGRHALAWSGPTPRSTREYDDQAQRRMSPRSAFVW